MNQPIQEIQQKPKRKTIWVVLIIMITALLVLFIAWSLIAKAKAAVGEPIMQCMDCSSGKNIEGLTCCSPFFDSICKISGGTTRMTDLHPVSTFAKACFQKASDAGKACAQSKDCLSSVCDLESAVKTNKCTLIEKKMTGEKNQFGGQEFYTAEYSCSSSQPGLCKEARENRTNPGGMSHYFEMKDNKLIETLTSGPIY